MFNMVGIAEAMKNIEKYGEIFHQALTIVKDVQASVGALEFGQKMRHENQREDMRFLLDEVKALRAEIRQLREGK